MRDDAETLFATSDELPHERAARGAVRAVDLRVTIDAAAGEQECARVRARQPLGRVDDGGMTRTLMARLAEKRRAHLEKRGLCRTVRIVAIGAVLRDRLVLPQEGPPEFSVTGGAGFRDGVLDELRRCRRAVRRMAGGTGHRSFPQRMMRKLEQIRAKRLMTARTDLDLGGGGLYRIFGCMQRVTACARHIARGVRARCPVMGGVRLVASETFHILRPGRRGR